MRATPILPSSMIRPARQGFCRWCDESILDEKGEQNFRRRWHPSKTHPCLGEFFVCTRPRKARQALRKRDKKICAKCGKKVNSSDAPWVADHIIPLFKSGGRLEFFKLENLQILCADPCNKEKTRTDMADYYALRRACQTPTTKSVSNGSSLVITQ
jgi:5-methylcytosine-specific restriction endonuclease McrA